MAELDRVTEQILDQISGEFKQEGAYNLRQNGVSICHGDSEHVKIKRKEDRQGIDIYIDGETKEKPSAFRSLSMLPAWTIRCITISILQTEPM